jgi:hypothetical protein
MSTAEILSTIAVLVSAGTLIVALQRFRHERKMEDRRDARSTLADGALELGRMKAVMKETLTDLQTPLRGAADWPVDFGDYIRALEQAKEALESALAATRIRFPQGAEVVVELNGAWESVRSLISVYVIAHGDRGSDPDSDWHEAWNLSEAFDQHKEEYLDAAQKAAGVKL